MHSESARHIDGMFLQREFEAFGVSSGAVVVVHASLSAFGDGGRCEIAWVHSGIAWAIPLRSVGDDNGTFFHLLGGEADAAGLIRHRMIGSAPCLLMQSVPFVDFAKVRLEQLPAVS